MVADYPPWSEWDGFGAGPDSVALELIDEVRTREYHDLFTNAVTLVVVDI
jgi:hypothetical protein